MPRRENNVLTKTDLNDEVARGIQAAIGSQKIQGLDSLLEPPKSICICQQWN